MESFVTITNSWKPLTIVAKRSILDACVCPDYTPSFQNSSWEEQIQIVTSLHEFSFMFLYKKVWFWSQRVSRNISPYFCRIFLVFLWWPIAAIEKKLSKSRKNLQSTKYFRVKKNYEIEKKITESRKKIKIRKNILESRK